MDVQQGVKRQFWTATITALDGTQRTSIVSFSSDDPEEEARVNAALKRGEIITEADLQPPKAEET